MKLTIQRVQNEKFYGKTRTVEFGVTFTLLLLPEEKQRIDYYDLNSYEVTSPADCDSVAFNPPASACSIPTYTLAQLHSGVLFAPPIGGVPSVPVTVLRLSAMLHAEDDVKQGCERLANVIENLVHYQGQLELLYEIE